MTPIDPDTQENIAKLIRELRSWHPGVPEMTIDELCARFDLPILVVKRICDSEGFTLNGGDGVPDQVHDDVSTEPISVGSDDV